MATRLNSSTRDDRYLAAAIRRVRRRLYGLVVAALLGTTIVYGQSWVLEEAPTPPIECAFVSGVAHVLQGELANN
jgi:hypothetical protein